MTVEKSDFARRIRETRIHRGLSQSELAEMTGVTQMTISRAERGSGDIRLGTLLEIARALELDLMLVDRSKRALVLRLIGDVQASPTAIYTGLGEEPYFDDDEDVAEEQHRDGLSDGGRSVRRLSRARRNHPRQASDDAP